MSATATPPMGRVLLVSAPWPLFNRPSLPLGALQAYLKNALPSLAVDSSHFFLEVAHALGFERYHRISRRVWRAEAVFSALLYPQRAQLAESLYAGTFKKSDPAPADFSELVKQVESVSNRWLDRIDGAGLGLVGFSVSFCQVTASLYLASRIKAAFPSLPVVVGGSSFSGERSLGLLNAFPQIDYLVAGEGELALEALARQLLSPAREADPPALPDGVFSLNHPGGPKRRFSQLRRLDALPIPDYDDYFRLLKGFSPSRRFFPTLPIEASRGCWWRGRDSGAVFNGCAFCNLNLQWNGYRIKPVHRVVREVEHLVQRHEAISLAFADNTLPEKQAARIFDGIGNLNLDLSIFAELRAKTPPSTLRKMKRAGVDTVQVGIEALSSRLLKKMNKGTRAIDNLCLMKYCEAAGIVNAGNLMLHFPSSDADDVAQTLECLKFARWYRPLKTVSFWLGLDSPVYRFPERFGIRSVFNHPNLKKLFPGSVANGLCFMIQGYRGDRQRQRKLWRQVQREVRQWHRAYEAMQRQTNGRPALAYRDGGRFIVIDQQFPQAPVTRHRLAGTSADIYRYCATPRSLEQIAQRFTAFSSRQIRSFLQSMVAKRLTFTESDWYFSLAAPNAWRWNR
ncbi:RiPP maturation radical SAM C-methyltransferase [uncultured Desulfosarcina sp.]|uniref:RiPP maturation radical SAM C-methyltransferase n=1 Tax=uncultured Desulfosarcina sp. TaxID=218289 RepID=UPI0029C63957|nr:RiPP maturation radical SAM C-methyltransferase [uncultured Desulfosarcina sp.]